MRISRSVLAFMLLAPLCGFSLYAQTRFTVGTASAAPGQKAKGYIEVPAGVDAGTNIPVVVVNGTKPGPVLALVTGAHGTEYVSIIAVEKLIGELDPAQISGTVVLLPLVNIASFEQKVPHVNPVDNKSMNRYYPGKMDGTQTDRALYMITKDVVDHCDYLIDYHGGDLDENLRPYAYWGAVGKKSRTVFRNRWCSRSASITLLFGMIVRRIRRRRGIWITRLRCGGRHRLWWKRDTRGLWRRRRGVAG